MVKVECANCRAEFNSPFTPSPARPLYCGFCELDKKDLTKLDMTLGLQEFLSRKIFAGTKGKIVVARDRGSEYEVVAAPAKGKAAPVCMIEFVPQYGADIPTYLSPKLASSTAPGLCLLSRP